MTARTVASCVSALAILLGISAWTYPPSYVSHAAIGVDPGQAAARFFPGTQHADAASMYARYAAQTLSNAGVLQIIDQLRLYPRLRTGHNDAEAIAEFRRSLKVKIEEPDMIAVSFTYGEPGEARAAVEMVVTGIINTWLRDSAAESRTMITVLEEVVGTAASDYRNSIDSHASTLEIDAARERYFKAKQDLAQAQDLAQMQRWALGPSLALAERPSDPRPVRSSSTAAIGATLGLSLLAGLALTLLRTLRG